MKEKATIIPLFLLNEVVLFPGMNLPLYVFEDRYKQLTDACLLGDKKIGIVYSKDDYCAEIGTIGYVIDSQRMKNNEMNVLLEGKERFKIVKILTEEPYCEAEVVLYEDSESKMDAAIKRKIKKIKEMSEDALELLDSISEGKFSKNIELPNEINDMLYIISANLTCKSEVKQGILETKSINQRVELILPLLEEEIEKLEVMQENKTTKEDVIKNGKLEY